MWLGHLPQINFDTHYPSPTLWELPNLDAISREDNALVPVLPGVREAVFRESVILVRKLVHCLCVMKILVAMGRSSWTAVAGYEACFYGAKAFCYILGFANLGRDSKFYVDVFSSTEVRRNKKKVEVFETFRVHKLDERMGHSTVWAMFSRLLETTDFQGALADTKRELRQHDWDRFPAFRNRLMYDGSFWPLSEQMEQCDLAQYVSNLEIYNALFHSVPTTSIYASEYFAACRQLHETLSLMIESIAELAPAIAAETVAIRNLEIPPP